MMRVRRGFFAAAPCARKTEKVRQGTGERWKERSWPERKFSDTLYFRVHGSQVTSQKGAIPLIEHLFPPGIGVPLAVIGHPDMSTVTLPISQPNPRLIEVPMQIKVRLDSRPIQRWARLLSKQTLLRAARVMGPTLVALTFAGVAHAQGTMDFSGAQTLMGTFNKRFAYVAVSRGSHDAHIYTDNAAALVEKLSHDVVKSSALQTGQQFATDQTTSLQL
jgi:hypothetical protein